MPNACAVDDGVCVGLEDMMTTITGVGGLGRKLGNTKEGVVMSGALRCSELAYGLEFYGLT